MRRVGAGAVAAAWALAGAAAAQEVPYTPSALPGPGVSICAGSLCQPEALAGVFDALAATEAGRREAPVHILQLGDSHTAGDRITGRVRAVLQARFGDAGRGVLPPGVPYDGYAPYGVEVAATGWRTLPAPPAAPGGFRMDGVGLTGVQAISLDPGAALRLRPESLDRGGYLIAACGEGEGRLQVETDGRTRAELSFAGPEGAPACAWTVLADRPEEVVLRPLDQRLKLHDLRLAGTGPGVVLSSLGVVGATLRDLAARDEAVVALQLASWRPSLIVLAYGTNEGFEDGLDPAAYEALLRGEIARLRRLAPAASLMILGAPDALRSGVEGGCSADGRRSPPPSLALVRGVQRRVAADTGVAFWDWRGRMGGDCSSDRLTLLPDPLMRGDRVHFTGAGADWIGGILADDLLAAYEAWKAGR